MDMHTPLIPLPYWRICAIVLFVAGCATSLGDNINIPVAELAMYESMPREKSIDHLEKNFLEAQKQGVPFLAPHYFAEASVILNRAKAAPNGIPTEQLAKADALLDQGESISKSIKQIFWRELELRDMLKAAGTSEIYPGEYKAVMSRLSRLIEGVELNMRHNVESDKNELNRDMQALYDKTLLSPRHKNM